jgi:hypothetical protein
VGAGLNAGVTDELLIMVPFHLPLLLLHLQVLPFCHLLFLLTARCFLTLNPFGLSWAHLIGLSVILGVLHLELLYGIFFYFH